MERSQSCSNFERNNQFVFNNNNSNNNSINQQAGVINGRQQRRTKTKSSSAHNLRNLLIDGRHSMLMQQAHELQQQHTDNMLLAQSMPHYAGSTRRKSPLQRQKSTMDPDELDYSADMEDDEDCDEHYRNDDQPFEASRHASHARGKKPQLHRTTLIIDTSPRNATHPATSSSSTSSFAMAGPSAASTDTPSTPTTTTTTPTTSPSPFYAKSFRLPANAQQLSLDLPHSPSPSLKMFMQHHQHYRHHSLGTPDSGTGSPLAMRRQHFGQLKRDNSLQSDSSHYSSVDSLLESRKPDPEAILINLGFGPAGTEDILSRIPKRFLKPSQVHGIDTEAFVKRLQLASSLADHSVLGYRGLTGNPDIPPSSIVAKIMQRFEVNERKKSMGSIETHMR